MWACFAFFGRRELINVFRLTHAAVFIADGQREKSRTLSE